MPIPPKIKLLSTKNKNLPSDNHKNHLEQKKTPYVSYPSCPYYIPRPFVFFFVFFFLLPRVGTLTGWIPKHPHGIYLSTCWTTSANHLQTFDPSLHDGPSPSRRLLGNRLLPLMQLASAWLPACMLAVLHSLHLAQVFSTAGTETRAQTWNRDCAGDFNVLRFSRLYLFIFFSMLSLGCAPSQLVLWDQTAPIF